MKPFLCLAALTLCLSLTSCLAQPAPVRSQPEPSAPPAQSQPQAQTPEAQAAQWLVDEDHTAFPVGNFWVTAQRTEQALENGLTRYGVILNVWSGESASSPLQTMEKESDLFGSYQAIDINFDGYPDITWQYFQGNQPTYWYGWVWDPDADCFVEVPEFARICMPAVDWETQTLHGFSRNGWAGALATQTIHRWVDGRLICTRRVDTNFLSMENDEEFVTTVEERLGDAFLTILRAVSDESAGFHYRSLWEDPDYTGDPGGFYDAFLEKFQNTPCRGFLVDTKGVLGQVLVTVEQNAETEPAQFSVWDPRYLEDPIQTFQAHVLPTRMEDYGWEQVQDLNGDGREDFRYGCTLDTEWDFPEDYLEWIWSEGEQQFQIQTLSLRGVTAEP